MEFKYFFLVIAVAACIVDESVGTSVWTLIHDVVQNNLAGVPVIHENTEWNFDPKQGKERRVRYEALNGHRGEDLIARLGMGMGFDGPWGLKVSSSKPNLRYNV